MKKIGLLLLVTVLILGCAAFPVASTPTPSLMPEPTDRTEVLTVKAGQAFDIVLPANPSTGYQWQIIGTPDAGLIEPAGQNYIPQQPVIPGSGGVEVWTFSALAPGETEIQFGYFPPGNTAQPEETAIFSISVE